MRKENSTQYWASRKNRLMSLANQTTDGAMKKVYLMAFCYCDKMIGRILRQRRNLAKYLGVVVLVFCLGYLGGCAKVLKGSGYMLEATGDAVSGIGNHLIETGEGQEK